MPIYEYKCADCNRRVSLFFPSFSAAESRTSAGENRCPRCEGANLTRLMSRVYSVRSGGSSGPDDDDFMGGDDGLLDGLNEDDPRSVARWARRMKDNMGEDLDMGPEFDQALARIESGEDPDKVMQDVDLDALDGGMGSEGLDGDFDSEE